MTGHSLLPLCGGAGAYPSAPLFHVGENRRVVYFDDYKYYVSSTGLEALLAPDGDIEAPPQDSEFLYDLGPGGQGEAKDLKTERHELLVTARKKMIQCWKELDAVTGGAPMNSALVQFFQKAGYMR